MRKGPSKNKSYFIRHTAGIATDLAAWRGLIQQRRFGIHYPDIDIKTNISLCPEDYKDPDAKGPVEVMRVLEEEGGYVWAQFQDEDGLKVLVGWAEPGSFKEVATTWLDPSPSGKHSMVKTGDPTALKTLALSSARLLLPHEAQHLRNARPLGTVCRWEAIEDGLERLVRGIARSCTLKSLTTGQLETMCSEYLREQQYASLPRLATLLERVGGNRAAIDFEGVTHEHRRILAQVTFHELKSVEGVKKLNRLRDSCMENIGVFFCDADKYKRDDDDQIHIVPLADVEAWVTKQGYFADLLI